MEQAVSDLILDIHRSSSTVSLADFKRSIFEQIQPILPFNSAVWVCGYINQDKLVTHDVCSFNQPPELYQMREQYEEHSGLLERMMAESGITLTRDMMLPRTNFRDLKIFKEYFSKNDMEHALGTVKRVVPANVYSYIAFYRTANEEAFSEVERRTKQTLVLHMIEALTYRLFYQFVERQNADSSDIGQIIVSAEGAIRCHSDCVVEKLKSLWPDWVGPYLPLELKSLKVGSKKVFETFEAIVGQPKDGWVCIELHPV